MAREQNTNRFGRPWSDQIQQAVWNTAQELPDCAPEIWRMDKYGMMIKWSDFGNRNSKYGWEIDHVKPVISGGNDSLENLQPLHWKNNAEKGDLQHWKSSVRV